MSFSKSRLGRGFLLAACVAALAPAGARAVGTAAGDVIGSVASVFRDVEVLAGGAGNKWEAIQKGYQVRLRDEIRTGPRGRARIEFADRLDESNAGPTVVNIGSNSHVKMESYAVRFQRPKKSEGIIGLIRGTIRAFTKNWGSGSAFKVRTGTSLCGIRGSEEIITFYGSDGDPTYQTCLSGNCFTLSGAGSRNLDTGYQRHIPGPDPQTWRDFKLSQAQIQRLIEKTEMPGNGGKSEEDNFEDTYGDGAGGGSGKPGDTWMGVRWTPEGIPDCKAEVAELVLNSYKWDDIKDYRDFTFYKDELINDRFVVSGMIQTNCLAELLNVQVSVDGGVSWAEARFSEETGSFRYAFDPTGFRDLDLRVRPTFRKEYVEKYQKLKGIGQ